MVTLVDNDVSEGTEFFLIAMSTSMEDVGLDDPAQVIISDDDSKCTYYSSTSFLHEHSSMFHI